MYWQWKDNNFYWGKPANISKMKKLNRLSVFHGFNFFSFCRKFCCSNQKLGFELNENSVSKPQVNCKNCFLNRNLSSDEKTAVFENLRYICADFEIEGIKTPNFNHLILHYFLRFSYIKGFQYSHKLEESASIDDSKNENCFNKRSTKIKNATNSDDLKENIVFDRNLTGKENAENSVNFENKSPYIPKYNGSRFIAPDLFVLNERNYICTAYDTNDVYFYSEFNASSHLFKINEIDFCGNYFDQYFDLTMGLSSYLLEIEGGLMRNILKTINYLLYIKEFPNFQYKIGKKIIHQSEEIFTNDIENLRSLHRVKKSKNDLNEINKKELDNRTGNISTDSFEFIQDYKNGSEPQSDHTLSNPILNLDYAASRSFVNFNAGRFISQKQIYPRASFIIHKHRKVRFEFLYPEKGFRNKLLIIENPTNSHQTYRSLDTLYKLPRVKNSQDLSSSNSDFRLDEKIQGYPLNKGIKTYTDLKRFLSLKNIEKTRQKYFLSSQTTFKKRERSASIIENTFANISSKEKISINEDQKKGAGKNKNQNAFDKFNISSEEKKSIQSNQKEDIWRTNTQNTSVKIDTTSKKNLSMATNQQKDIGETNAQYTSDKKDFTSKKKTFIIKDQPNDISRTKKQNDVDEIKIKQNPCTIENKYVVINKINEKLQEFKSNLSQQKLISSPNNQITCRSIDILDEPYNPTSKRLKICAELKNDEIFKLSDSIKTPSTSSTKVEKSQFKTSQDSALWDSETIRPSKICRTDTIMPFSVHISNSKKLSDEKLQFFDSYSADNYCENQIQLENKKNGHEPEDWNTELDKYHNVTNHRIDQESGESTNETNAKKCSVLHDSSIYQCTNQKKLEIDSVHLKNQIERSLIDHHNHNFTLKAGKKESLTRQEKAIVEKSPLENRKTLLPKNSLDKTRNQSSLQKNLDFEINVSIQPSDVEDKFKGKRCNGESSKRSKSFENGGHERFPKQMRKTFMSHFEIKMRYRKEILRKQKRFKNQNDEFEFMHRFFKKIFPSFDKMILKYALVLYINEIIEPFIYQISNPVIPNEEDRSTNRKNLLKIKEPRENTNFSASHSKNINAQQTFNIVNLKTMKEVNQRDKAIMNCTKTPEKLIDTLIQSFVASHHKSQDIKKAADSKNKIGLQDATQIAVEPRRVPDTKKVPSKYKQDKSQEINIIIKGDVDPSIPDIFYKCLDPKETYIHNYILHRIDTSGNLFVSRYTNKYLENLCKKTPRYRNLMINSEFFSYCLKDVLGYKFRPGHAVVISDTMNEIWTASIWIDSYINRDYLFERNFCKSKKGYHDFKATLFHLNPLLTIKSGIFLNRTENPVYGIKQSTIEPQASLENTKNTLLYEQKHLSQKASKYRTKYHENDYKELSESLECFKTPSSQKSRKQFIYIHRKKYGPTTYEFKYYRLFKKYKKYKTQKKQYKLSLILNQLKRFNLLLSSDLKNSIRYAVSNKIDLQTRNAFSFSKSENVNIIDPVSGLGCSKKNSLYEKVSENPKEPSQISEKHVFEDSITKRVRSSETGLLMNQYNNELCDFLLRKNFLEGSDDFDCHETKPNCKKSSNKKTDQQNRVQKGPHNNVVDDPSCHQILSKNKTGYRNSDPFTFTNIHPLRNQECLFAYSNVQKTSQVYIYGYNGLPNNFCLFPPKTQKIFIRLALGAEKDNIGPDPYANHTSKYNLSMNLQSEDDSIFFRVDYIKHRMAEAMRQYYNRALLRNDSCESKDASQNKNRMRFFAADVKSNSIVSDKIMFLSNQNSDKITELQPFHNSPFVNQITFGNNNIRNEIEYLFSYTFFAYLNAFLFLNVQSKNNECFEKFKIMSKLKNNDKYVRKICNRNQKTELFHYSDFLIGMSNFYSGNQMTSDVDHNIYLRTSESIHSLKNILRRRKENESFSMQNMWDFISGSQKNLKYKHLVHRIILNIDVAKILSECSRDLDLYFIQMFGVFCEYFPNFKKRAVDDVAYINWKKRYFSNLSSKNVIFPCTESLINCFFQNQEKIAVDKVHAFIEFLKIRLSHSNYKKEKLRYHYLISMHSRIRKYIFFQSENVCHLNTDYSPNHIEWVNDISNYILACLHFILTSTKGSSYKIAKFMINILFMIFIEKFTNNSIDFNEIPNNLPATNRRIYPVPRPVCTNQKFLERSLLYTIKKRIRRNEPGDFSDKKCKLVDAISTFSGKRPLFTSVCKRNHTPCLQSKNSMSENAGFHKPISDLHNASFSKNPDRSQNSYINTNQECLRVATLLFFVIERDLPNVYDLFGEKIKPFQNSHQIRESKYTRPLDDFFTYLTDIFASKEVSEIIKHDEDHSMFNIRDFSANRSIIKTSNKQTDYKFDQISEECEYSAEYEFDLESLSREEAADISNKDLYLNYTPLDNSSIHKLEALSHYFSLLKDIEANILYRGDMHEFGTNDSDGQDNVSNENPTEKIVPGNYVFSTPSGDSCRPDTKSVYLQNFENRHLNLKFQNISNKSEHMKTDASEVINFETPESTLDEPILMLRKSNVHGIGCFTTKKIKKNTYIGWYYGYVVDKMVADHLEKIYKDQNIQDIYMFDSHDVIIDATCYGSRLKYTNHACIPNVEAVIDQDEPYSLIYFSSLRDIEEGEELFLDYKLPEGEKISCNCRQNNCKGYISR